VPVRAAVLNVAERVSGPTTNHHCWDRERRSARVRRARDATCAHAAEPGASVDQPRQRRRCNR